MENYPVTVEDDSQVQVSLEMDPSAFADLVEASASMTRMDPVISLTAEYISLEKPGESFRGIFVGFQEIEVTDKTSGERRRMDAAKFIHNRRVVINSGVALVNDIKRAKIQPGTPLEVVFKGKNGNAKVYTLNLLAISSAEAKKK
jgi:hypothetical protein